MTEEPDDVSTAHDYYLSHLRTFVPLLVGPVLAWLANKGIDLSDQSPAIVALVSSVLIALYYSTARALERKWPKAGKLMLGSSKVPIYLDKRDI
jgi:hypothetical protein